MRRWTSFGGLRRSLAKLTDKDLGDDRKAWLEWYKIERREAAKAERAARSE